MIGATVHLLRVPRRVQRVVESEAVLALDVLPFGQVAELGRQPAGESAKATKSFQTERLWPSTSMTEASSKRVFTSGTVWK
jgi:hypothetical protein